MAYCRFSDNDFACDVYAFESCYGGYQIYLARNKVIGDIPKVDYSLLIKGKIDTKEFAKQHKAQMNFLDTAKREPLNLGLDYDSCICETLQDFYNKMTELKTIGYRFPDYVLEDIKNEIEEETKRTNLPKSI